MEALLRKYERKLELAGLAAPGDALGSPPSRGRARLELRRSARPALGVRLPRRSGPLTPSGLSVPLDPAPLLPESSLA